MLTDALKAFFAQRPATDLARSAQARWEDWLQPISAAAPAGADPCYEDDFLAMREEVAKLTDIDDARLIDTAQALLKHTAKDVRVAVYYVYGRLRRDGAEGIAEGLELLAALVDRFGDALLPARPEARKAAIDWLAGDTFAQRVDSLQSLPGALLERSLSALAMIAEGTVSWPPTGRPELAPLIRRLESRIEASPIADTAGPSATTTLSNTSSPAAEPLTSTHEMLHRARQMAAFLRKQAHGELAACRLMRCVRWDTLYEVPPHDASGMTRLPAPRAELRSNLKRLLLQKQWPELRERVEAAFAEGANHFWLDLQYYAHMACENSGGPDAVVRDQIAIDCARLLQRLPGLEQLAFNDGLPFADGTTLAWIGRHAAPSNVQAAYETLPPPVEEGQTNWTDVEAQAQNQATQQGLDAAFTWLLALPHVDTERGRFLRQFVMARVAERANRADLALHLLTELDATAARHRLSRWEPALAFDVKQHLLRVLKLRMSHKDADKPTLARRIDTLLGELTATDPARAAQLL
jgi:type VI secretion system protein VasJ